MKTQKNQWLFTAGNLIEWYDFCLFGYYAVILSQQFFPKQHAYIALLSIFATYAIGFFVRPIGGYVMGRVGEKVSLRLALLLSYCFMLVPSILTGLLPTYQSIGILAPIALLLLRCLQGFSAGGQYTMALVSIADRSPEQKMTQNLSKVYMGSVVGYLLSSLVGVLVFFSPIPQAIQWRIPFLLTVFFIPLVPMLSRFLASVEQQAKSKKSLPLTQYSYSVFKVFLLSCVGSAIYFSIYVYLISFIHNYVPLMTMHDALFLNAVSFVALLVFIPIAAKISDKIGIEKVLYFSLLALLFVYPILQMLFLKNWFLKVLAMIILSFIGACYNTPVATLFIRQLPRDNRLAGTALGFNLGAAAMGGTTPFIITSLIHWLAPVEAVSMYLLGVAVLGIVVVKLATAEQGARRWVAN